MPTRDDLIYAAAIMDGEGSVSICLKGYGNYVLQVHVGTTDGVIVPWMQQTFGGAIYHYRGAPPRRRLNSWVPRSGEVIPFLGAIRPFLKLKGPQADLAIAFRNTVRHSPANTTVVVQQYRKQLYEKMLALNGGEESPAEKVA